jgi:hypothetical protein
MIVSCEEKGRECKNILVGFEYVESGGTKVISDNHKEQGTRNKNKYRDRIHKVHTGTKLNQCSLTIMRGKGQECKNIQDKATMPRNKMTAKKVTQTRIVEIIDNGENSKSRARESER